MSVPRSLIALFAVVVLLVSGLVPASAATTMAQSMACCKAVKHHCHQPHETMRCCAPSERTNETPLPSSTTRIEPPLAVAIAQAAPADLPVPFASILPSVRGTGRIGDISPH